MMQSENKVHEPDLSSKFTSVKIQVGGGPPS